MNPVKTAGAAVVISVFLAIFAGCEKTEASIRHAGKSTGNAATVIAQDAVRSDRSAELTLAATPAATLTTSLTGSK